MATAKSPYTKKELGEIRDGLVKERELLAKQAEELEQQSFGAAQSEMTGEMAFDEEYADAGTATFEREKDLSLTNNMRDLMEKIDGALERIEDGSYGICRMCGKPIEKARLKALPYTDLCIKDAQAEGRSR